MRLKISALLMAVSTVVLAQQPTWLQMWNDQNTNVYDVVKEFDSAFEGKAMEKGKGWKQFKRWEAFMDPRVYPTGQRPSPTALFEACNKCSRLGEARALARVASANGRLRVHLTETPFKVLDGSM